MKVLVMLSFTTLCCIFGLGAGAVVKQEMPADTELLMKDVLENGVKYFAKTLATEDSGSLMKNNLNLDDEDYKADDNEDIGEYPSSFSFEENDDDENMLNWNDISLQNLQDPSKMTDSKMKCAWDAETYKCCKPLDTNNTACVGAGIADEKIHISLQIDGTTVWKKIISYKTTLEKFVKAATTMVAGNDGVKDSNNVDPESFYDDKESTGEDGSDITEIIDGENSGVIEKTADSQKASLSRGRGFQICITRRIFRRRFRLCMGLLYYPRGSRLLLYLRFNNRIFWRRYIRTRQFTVCRSIYRIGVCFQVYHISFSRRYIRACFQIYARKWYWRIRLLRKCVFYRLPFKEIPSAATMKPVSFMAGKEIGDILFPKENFKGNTLKFEQQDFI